MIIGNFNYNKAQDSYTGEIVTLSGATRKLAFKPSEAKADKAPHYRVIGSSKAGDIEFGAAWKKRTALMHYLRQCVRIGGVLPPAGAVSAPAWPSAALRETRRGDLFAAR